MEITAHFSNIRQLIISEIEKAESEILIAMAWFTDQVIFDLLVSKLSNVSIKLIVINDDVNNRVGGLNFQRFIDAGGDFYFGKLESPMHHKYCIIDNRVLLTGSYNYTYWAFTKNEENLTRFVGCSDVISAFTDDFNSLIAKLPKVENVESYLKIYPFVHGWYSYSNFIVRDTYQQALDLKDRGHLEESNELISTLDNVEREDYESEHFIINNVAYRQWKEDYYADKVEVIGNEIIIDFRTVINSAWINGPGTIGSWVIMDVLDENNYEIVDEITDIRIDGVLVSSVAKRNTIYHFDKKGGKKCVEEDYFWIDNKGNIFTKDNKPINYQRIPTSNEQSLIECKIHFKDSCLTDKIIHLIEGIGTNTKENHWHCFDINLRLNREYI